MTIDLTQIILGIITILFGILMRYAIPLIESKIRNEEAEGRELQAALLRGAVQTAVYAAEQLYKSTQGTEKKSYVLSQLQAQGYNVDAAMVDAAIEAAVKELKIEMNRQ